MIVLYLIIDHSNRYIMGNFLSDIKGHEVSVDEELLNSSHSKLVEYYSSYKSICEGYTINVPEYTHIFGPSQLSFEVWDTKRRGKIDAIEMFTGLITFSSIGFEQKMKFLFEVFDFNEEGSLCYENVALMLINVCNATYKIFSMPKTVANPSIEEFLDEYFTQESEISYHQLLRWTLRVSQFGEYFKIINHQIEQLAQQKKISEVSCEQYDKMLNNKVYFTEKELNFDSKFMTRLESFFFKPRSGGLKEDSKEMLNLEVDWIYGINAKRQNIKHVCSKGLKAANERIVYTVGKVIIVYYPKLNSQQYYKEHRQSISVIEISKEQRLAASGEEGEYPQIHIWDMTTKKTLVKFSNLHKDSITFLKFIKNDRQLITASHNSTFSQSKMQTPLVILNLQTQEIIMSTFLQYEIIGFAFNHEFPLKLADFLVVSSKELAFFSQQQDSYQLFSEKIKINEPIVSFAFNQKGLLVTGHSRRKLYKWDDKFASQSITFASNYEKEIKEMVFLGDEQLFLMDENDLQVIRFENQTISRVYTMRLRETRLFNTRLLHLEKVQEEGLLVLSEFGDVFKITELNHLEKPAFQKYFQFFSLLNPSDYGQVSDSKNLIASGQCLYLLDKYEKELCTLARLEYEIEQVECGKDTLIVLAVASEDKIQKDEAQKVEKSDKAQKSKLLLSVSPSDFRVKEIHKTNQKTSCIVLSQNYLLQFSDNFLAVFHKTHQKFFQKKPNTYNAPFGIPVSVVQTAEKQVLVLFNTFKQMWKLTLGSHSQVDIKKIEKQSNLFQVLSSQSYDDSKENLSFQFCANIGRKIFAVAQNNGDILIWDSMSQALSHMNSPLKLHFHCGQISRLLMKEEEMVSLGGEDGMLVLFKHKKYIQMGETEPFVQQSIRQSEQLMDSIAQSRQINHSDVSMGAVSVKTDDLGSDFLKESEVEIQPLPNEHASDLKKIIQQILNPKDKTSYQPQIRENSPVNESKLSLNVEGVYGLSCKNCLSVFYRHSYTREPEPLIPVSNSNELASSAGNEKSPEKSENNEEFHFSKTLLLPLDESHLGCNRDFFYATDRFCVLRQRKENKQRIYDFHRRKVTCIAIHPDKQIVISCEESPTYPNIHVWEADQMATRAVIPTRHGNIITRAVFSRDGEWVGTLGGKQREQSIQVTSWRDEEQISFKLIEGQILRDIAFNPYERRQISVVGWQVIKIYKYAAGVMMLTDECRVIHDFQVVTYTSSVYGDNIESDLIVGNSTGDLGIFICGKYIATKEHAHSAAICCLRVAQLFGYKRVLITGGADSVVKIWDIKFNELSHKNIQQELYSFRVLGEEKPECRITSLDVYQCLKGQGVDRPPTLLLISASDGSVLQATIHNEFQGYQTRSLATQEVRQLKEKINFDISLLFSGPICLPSTRFDILKSMMVTFNSTSPFLQFWSLQNWERSLVFRLPELPCVVSFMSERPILVVAYLSMSVNYCSLYEVQFQNLLLKGLRLISQPPLPKGHGQPISATFSNKDSRLALLCSQSELNSVYLFTKEEQYKDLLLYKGKIQNSLLGSFIEFSSSGDVVMVAWTDPKRSNAIDQDYVIKCYSSDTQEELPPSKFDFRRFDFSKKIKANYIPCSQLGRFEQDSLLKYAIKMTTMAQYDRFLLLGTNHGEVLVVQSSFFSRKRSEDRTLIRNFIVCDSPIASLEVREDTLYVGSEQGQGVLKVKVSLEQAWSLPAAAKDRYSYNLTPQALQFKIKDVYSKRRKMQTEQKDDSIESKCEGRGWLRLAAVVGRSAFTKRNNLFVDLKDCIICFSGCNILINKHRPGKQLQQLVIKPDPTPGSIHPEISAMVLAEDKRLLLVGTAEEEAKLLLWNISTNTYLTQIPLPTFVSVLILKLSLSAKRAAIVGLTSKSGKNLLYIDLQKKTVIGVYRLVNIELNDICFAGAEEHRILGCGPNYMGEWVFKNGILIASKYSLGNSQDLLDLKATGIIFYSLIYIEDMAISSGSDGYLYVWREGGLAKRQNAHPGHQVLSLYAATNSKVFASGGTNGRVVVWKVWSSMIIQHQGEYPKEGSLKFPVQSISMTRESLIVGDISGAIVQFAFGGEQGYGCQTLLSPFDHECINSCAFSTDSKRLYVLTSGQSMGTFAIYDTTSFQKLREERIEFKSELVRMLSCKLINRIFFVMKNSIAENSVMGEGKEDRGRILKFKWSWKCEAGVKAATMSSQENYLAVLVAQSEEHNSKIEIYNLSAPDTHFYKVYWVEDNIPASIDLIDFCIDHDYLLFQGPDEEQTIIDLMSREKIKMSVIESELEWAEEAKKTSRSVTDIVSQYSEESKLLRLVQVMNKCLVATDEMGRVRVYSKGVLSQVCIEHLNQVYICEVSSFNKLIVTVGKEDRAMHFWEFVDRS